MGHKHILTALTLIGVNGGVPALGQTQQDLNEVAALEARTAEQRLDAVLTETAERLSPLARPRLFTAQAAWAGFREAECRYRATAVEGGSAAPMVYARCLATLTEERTRTLVRYGICEEGDLACPR